MNFHKILVIVLVIILLVFSSTNSKSVYTIDNCAYVIGIGIDISNNTEIKLSLQIAIPSSGSNSESSSSSSQSSSFIISTVECNTIESGINMVNSLISKKVNLSYCKVVVFSEEIASKGIINYVATLINDVEVRPYCNIIVSKCEAKYFLQNSKPSLEELSSNYYKVEQFSESSTGYTKQITILDFYNAYYDTFCEPSAILGNVSVDNSIETLGLAVFHSETLVGEISAYECIYHLIISNKFKTTILNIPSPFNDSDYIAIYISNTHSKNKVKIINGSPYITCNVSLNARIHTSTFNSNYMSKNNLKTLEEYANSFIKSNIEDYLYKTSVNLQSDINKFGKYAVQNFKLSKDFEQYNWISNYKNSTFKVNVDTKIKSSYLVVNSLSH